MIHISIFPPNVYYILMLKKNKSSLCKMLRNVECCLTDREPADSPVFEPGTRWMAETQRTRSEHPAPTPQCRSTPRWPCPSRAGSSSETHMKRVEKNKPRAWKYLQNYKKKKETQSLQIVKLIFKI